LYFFKIERISTVAASMFLRRVNSAYDSSIILFSCAAESFFKVVIDAAKYD